MKKIKVMKAEMEKTKKVKTSKRIKVSEDEKPVIYASVASVASIKEQNEYGSPTRCPMGLRCTCVGDDAFRSKYCF